MNPSANSRDGGSGSGEQRLPADINRQTLFRQRGLLAIAGLAAVAVAGTITYLNTPANSGSLAIATEPRLSLPSSRIDEAGLWRSSAESDLQLLAERDREIGSALTKLDDRMAELRNEVRTEILRRQELEFEREIVRAASLPVEATTLPDNARPRTPPSAEGQRGPASIILVKIGSPRPKVSPSVSTIVSGDPALDPAPSPESAPPKTGADEIHLPSGSFMAAVIIGGIDAPTSHTAQDNPHPVLLRIAEHARLPGLVQRDLRECLVLAAGYGDISSERALIRTESMSCHRRDNNFFDAPIHGFIVGEDGRAGVRGKLVTRRGKELQALIAGSVAGLSNLLALNTNAWRTPSPSTGSATAAPKLDFSDFAVAGVTGGFRSAADRLADYYLRLTDQIHPVIEIGAGRTVDIVLQTGITLDALAPREP